MSAVTNPDSALQTAEKIFSRILVGVDGSPESLDAAQQAALLKAPGGTLTLLAAWNLEPPLVTPMTMLPAYGSEAHAARIVAEDAVHAAEEQLPTARRKVIHGFPAHALLDEITRERSTLVAVGSHGQGRAAGILVGSTTTKLVHDAPCSLLVARTLRDVPRRIAVGVDGSQESAAAYRTACYLAERFDGDVTVIAAEGGKLLDVAGVSLIVGDGFQVIPDEPVPVLVAASADADLLVLGSRGLHGLKSLGSVAERVAHRAECSTLIVRGN